MIIMILKVPELWMAAGDYVLVAVACDAYGGKGFAVRL